MSPELIGVLGFVALVVLLALRVPVGIAMIAVSAVCYSIVVSPEAALARLGSDAFSGTASYSLSVIPLFILMGLAYAQVRGDHIRVDLLYEHLGLGGRRVLGLFAALVSFVTVAVLTSRLWAYAGQLAASGRTTSALRIPLSWVAWIAVAGGVIYAAGVVVTADDRGRSSETDVAGTAQPTSDDDTSRGGTVDDVT